jgi:glycosyltransferase involved in cell wall biosynthesis
MRQMGPQMLRLSHFLARLAGDAAAALTVPPSDGAALADALPKLRADVSLRDELSTAGRRFAVPYLRERHVERLEEVLRSATR